MNHFGQLIIPKSINDFNIKKKTHVKNKFKEYEDQKLIEIVKNHNFSQNELALTKSCGTNDDWFEIAQELNTGRNARQCRERWLYYLSPYIHKEPWTDEEDKLLIEK